MRKDLKGEQSGRGLELYLTDNIYHVKTDMTAIFLTLQVHPFKDSLAVKNSGVLSWTS